MMTFPPFVTALSKILGKLGVVLLASQLGLSDLPSDNPYVVRYDAAAFEIAQASYEECSDLGEAGMEQCGRVAMVMGHFESANQANPKGSNDKGGACGSMQVHVSSVPEGWLPKEWTCAALRADRELGYRAGLRVVRRLWDKCGSLGAGLSAFAMHGECPPINPATGKRYVLMLIQSRCHKGGVTC